MYDSDKPVGNRQIKFTGAIILNGQSKVASIDNQSLWTKNFILICLTNLFMFTSFYFLLPTLPVYVTDVLQGDESSVGYIIGILSLTAVLVRPISGYLLDTVGRRTTLLYAFVAFILAMVAYEFTASLLLLFLLRFFHGLSWGFTTTGAGTMAADVIPPAKRGEGLGYYGLSNTLAMALGPSLGLLILGYGGFSVLFWACVGVAIFGFLSLLAVQYEESGLKKVKTKFSWASAYEPRVLSLSLVMFFVALVYGGIVSFITLYGKEIGVGNAGVYFLFYALTLMAVRPIAGKVFDRSGPVMIMAIGFLAVIVSFVVLAYASNEILFIASSILMGVGFGIVHPTAMAMAINRVEPFRRGAANGTIFSAFDLGIGLGSILLGALSRMIGLDNMYLVCALIIVVPAILFYMNDAKVKDTGAKVH